MVLAPRPRRATAITAVAGMAALALALTAGPATAGPSPSAAPHALAVPAADGLVAARPAAPRAGKDDTFHAHPTISTREGLRYVPYDRTYKGLPVIGGDFVIITNSIGKVLSVSGQPDKIINLSTAAAQTAAQAAASARRHAAGKTVDSVSGTRKVVLAIDTPQLAYETVVVSHTGARPSKLHVFTDANTGALAYSYDQVREGTGTAHYNGPNPVTISTSHPTSTTWNMTDPTRSGITCRDFASKAVLSGSDDVWGNGSATNQETGCVDAKYDVEHEWSMLSAWLGRNGITGSGGGFPISMGLNDVNAYYDGTQVAVGHNNAGENIAVLDVVGHEFGHAVDDYTPGGIGSSAVAEFTADVFGALTEAYANESASYDPPDYTVGEEVNLVGSGPIRYMYNPSLAGDPNCYSSSIPSTETHSAAGPGNHWFYLVAEGTNPTNGQPTSPTCNGSTVSGIGIQTAGKIFYHAMLAKTTGMTYLKYRTATLNAAKNLYPGSCTNFNVVKAAWNAVSVPAQTGDPTCTTSGALSVNNPGSQTGTVGTAKSLQMSASGGTAPYSWSATGLPAGLSINASTGLISGTPTTAGTYNSTVTAKDTTSATASASFSWTISSTGSGCTSAGQKLGNPGFETGTAAPWSASAGVIDSSTAEPARSGSWKAWLNGYGTTHTDTLTQSVTLPAGCTTYTLSFWLHIDTAEATTTIAYDKLTVKIGSTTLATYSNLNKNTGYVQKSFNVASLAGQTVTVSFSGVEDSSLQTSFVIDDTALNVG